MRYFGMRKFGLKVVTALVLLIIIGAPDFAYGQTDPRDYVIGEIRLHGNKHIATEEILRVMKTHAGDRFSREAVVEDLKAINALGYFDERKLEVSPELVDGKVLLSIEVQENPVVKGFSLSGNTLVSRPVLLKYLERQVGKPQNADILEAAINDIEALYHGKGFILSKVRDVAESTDGFWDIVIDEGIISKVEVSGVPESIQKQVAGAISIKAGSVYSEKNLTASLRTLYKKGGVQDIRRSLGPDADKVGSYKLSIEIVYGLRQENPLIKEIALNTDADSFKVWVEELFEDPQYEFELVRRVCSMEEEFGKSIKPSSDGRKLIRRTVHFERPGAYVGSWTGARPSPYVGIFNGVRGYRAYANLGMTNKFMPSGLNKEAQIRAPLDPRLARLSALYFLCPKMFAGSSKVLITPLLNTHIENGRLVK